MVGKEENIPAEGKKGPTKTLVLLAGVHDHIFLSTENTMMYKVVCFLIII